MTFYSAIDCAEIYGTAQEDYAIEGGIQASVTLRVSNDLKEALISDLLNYQRYWPNPNLYEPPRAYAASARPFATNTSVDGQRYVWDSWDVSVKYSTDPDRNLVSESLEPEAEFTRLDHRHFRWDTDGAPLTEGEAPGLLIRSMKLKRKYFQALSIPSQVLLVGAVHNAAYTSPTLGLTFPAESMLLTPEPISSTTTTAGFQGYDWGVSFSIKYNGWNKYWRPSTGTWDRIKQANGSAYNSYTPTDLSALLS